MRFGIPSAGMVGKQGVAAPVSSRLVCQPCFMCQLLHHCVNAIQPPIIQGRRFSLIDVRIKLLNDVTHRACAVTAGLESHAQEEALWTVCCCMARQVD
jgi:hypothetical protein